MSDYLRYALGQLQAAIEKADDAPAAACGHEQSAKLALVLERIPTYEEWNASWLKEAAIDDPHATALALMATSTTEAREEDELTVCDSCGCVSYRPEGSRCETLGRPFAKAGAKCDGTYRTQRKGDAK